MGKFFTGENKWFWSKTFEENANYGPESDCEYHYKFSSTKKSSTEEAKKIFLSMFE